MISKEEAQAMLPRLGEVRMERPTIDGVAGNGYGHTPRRCTVVDVRPEHLWYTVEFEDGIRESYKVPPEQPRERGGGYY